MQPPKLVVIGLELGDGGLIDQWSSAGLLPTLQQWRRTGSWAWLSTSADQLHISAWPSLYTGSPPGEHGVYFTFQPAPGLQGYSRFHEGLYGRPTFWQLLDRTGARCCVLDPPYVHPEPGFKGRLIYDWGTWAHYLSPGSVPPGLLKRLESECGKYPMGYEANDLGLAPLQPQEITERIIASITAKTDAICWLMRESPADLLFAVFGETHVAGHYCWTHRLLDPQHSQEPSHMFRIYQALDRALAKIQQDSGPEATLIVVSGDRVGPNHAGCHLLPDILQRLGYFNAGAVAAAGAAAARRFDPVKALRDLLPKGFRKSLARCLPTQWRDKLAQRVDTADIDWARTRAYCLPTDLEGCIRVNLKGREPFGIVEQGQEYENLLDDMAGELGKLVDPKSGTPIVQDIVRTDRAFPGARRQYLPDLIVRWNMASPIVAAASPRLGSLAKPSPDPRPGTHTGPGFVLIHGARGGVGQQMTGRDILDLAPSILAHFGVEAPAYMPGHVWPELKSDGLATRRIAS